MKDAKTTSHRTERDLFLEALEQPTAEERAAAALAAERPGLDSRERAALAAVIGRSPLTSEEWATAGESLGLTPQEQAALAATVFHSGQIPIPDLKQSLADAGVEVRPC